MQLRVLSQVKVDEVGTSQVNLTTKSNVIKKRNTIIVEAIAFALHLYVCGEKHPCVLFLELQN